jgi:hypothetical protein
LGKALAGQGVAENAKAAAQDAIPGISLNTASVAHMPCSHALIIVVVISSATIFIIFITIIGFKTILLRRKIIIILLLMRNQFLLHVDTGSNRHQCDSRVHSCSRRRLGVVSCPARGSVTDVMICTCCNDGLGLSSDLGRWEWLQTASGRK